jgi:hypothetical protein
LLQNYDTCKTGVRIRVEIVVHSSRRIAVYGLSSFFVLSILAVALLGSMSAMAGLGPKVVQGYVYDNAGNKLGGATVTVVVMNSTTHLVRDTQTDTTGSDGYYMVSFDPNKWDIGDTIRARATSGSVQSDANQTIANESGAQDLDVHFKTAIPQFGSVLGFCVAAGLVCAVGLAFVSRRRKN